MNVHEILIAPETRRDAAGEYQYVCIGAWTNLAAKQRGDGITLIVGGVERTCELFNDFRVRYSSQGVRIISRVRNDTEEFQRSDGRWVRRDRISAADEQVGWNRETFTRDTSREIEQCIGRYMLRAANLGYRGDMRGTTLNLQVAASNADAYETELGLSFTSTAADVIMDANASAVARYNGGFFFSGATIAAGSTINSATLTVDVVSTFWDDPRCNIYCNDVDSAANFSDEADVTSRVVTTASTAWTGTGVGAGLETSPSFPSALQEVIDRAGWAGGNNLCVIVKGNDSGTFQFRVDSYDTDTANACKCDIDYTEPTTGQPFYLRDERTIPAFSAINPFSR